MIEKTNEEQSFKVSKEELEFAKQQILEYRKKKQQKATEPQEQELDIEEVEQDIINEEEPENECENCGWKFNGKPERCPQCDVELDWGD